MRVSDTRCMAYYIVLFLINAHTRRNPSKKYKVET